MEYRFVGVRVLANQHQYQDSGKPRFDITVTFMKSYQTLELSYQGETIDGLC